MNYLAVYNKELKEIRSRLCDYLNEFSIEIVYSRYDRMKGKFKLKIPDTSIKIKETEKSVIGFTFSTQGIQFESQDGFYEKWTSIFEELLIGFINSQYLDIKEKFLEVTDEDNLNDFLAKTFIASTLDSELGKKLIEIFKKTDMYKNICEDYKNLNRNYKKFSKNVSREVELFKLEFLNNGKIQMVYDKMGDESKKMCDDFRKLITFITTIKTWKYTLEYFIEGERKQIIKQMKM